MTRSLRAVQPGEPPKPPAKQSVAQAAASGSHRALLVSMRERIAVTVSDPECPPRDLASLTRRLQEIAKEIDVIDARAKEDGENGDASTADESWNAEAL